MLVHPGLGAEQSPHFPDRDVAWASPSADGASPWVATNLQGGQSIALNGAVLSAPWVVVDGRIEIADFALSDHLGATLINSTDPAIQPVQWFTPAGQPPIHLPAHTDSGHRFLDITTMAEQHNWQMVPAGATLHITSPIQRIQSIQQESWAGGERLMLSLSGNTMPHLTEQVGGFTLRLGATVDEATVTALSTDQGESALLSDITLVPNTDSTTLTGRIPPHMRPVLSTLANPSRVVIDLRPDFLAPRDIQWAAGVRWRQQYLSVSGKSFPVYWLQVNPRQTNLTLRPIRNDPTTATGITPLITMAQRWQASAAINGGFFNRNNQYPLGAVRYAGEWISGPILSRGVVAWDDAGQVTMQRLFLKQTLIADNGQSFPIQAVNSGYVQAGIGLYTSAWGANYRPITDNEILIPVIDGQVTAQQTASASDGIAMPIPANGALLALRSFTTAARALPPGTGITIQSDPLPAELAPFPNVVGGGPLLIHRQTIVLNAELEQFSAAFATQSAPRSAIGLTAAGELLLVTVHHSPAGPGPTLQDLAQIMAQLGSTDALNLDGGSSSSLYLGGRLLNRNSRTAARVNNGIGLFLE
jgi:hypothetical protein